MFGCRPGAVGARRFAGLWQPFRTDAARLDAPIEEIGDIDAWRPEASMPGCHVGWLAVGWLAGLAGWLAGLARLAGCSWRVAAGWLLQRRNSHTLDAPGFGG